MQNAPATDRRSNLHKWSLGVLQGKAELKSLGNENARLKRPVGCKAVSTSRVWCKRNCLEDGHPEVCSVREADVRSSCSEWLLRAQTYVFLRKVERQLCAAGLTFLYRRTWHSGVGAIDAAIPFERFQHRMAGLAFIEPLTRIRGHRLVCDMPAFRTGDC